MQLQQLVYFLTVAHTRHFTQAAQQLEIAQPSLSQQIRALEKSLGAELFDRIRGNITLTPAGEALLPIAERITADVESARQEVRELVELRHGRVRLGAPPSLLTGLLPGVARLYRQRYPGIRLVIDESGSRDLVAKAATGALDLALLVLPLHADDPALVTTPLLREDLVVVSAMSEPAPTDGRPIAIAELRGRPMVMFRPGYDLREATVSACRRAGFVPVMAVEGGEMDAVLSMVEAGVGLAVLPSTVVAGRTATHRVTPITSPGLSRTIGLAHRSGAQPPRAARELRQALMEYLSEMARDGRLPVGTELITPTAWRNNTWTDAPSAP
ncbi:MAG TPA: LysR family transcriptional regulator [Kineosporiaceae bacterium]|nr:LysR family transcriptional regulator [Kineosporiaceae bacterium]